MVWKLALLLQVKSIVAMPAAILGGAIGYCLEHDTSIWTDSGMLSICKDSAEEFPVLLAILFIFLFHARVINPLANRFAARAR